MPLSAIQSAQPPAEDRPSPWPARASALLVGLVVVALLVLFVWALGRGGTTGLVATRTRPAPDFELALLSRPAGGAERWRLGDVAQPMLVNFWASWCIPCEDEAPVLEQASRRFRGRVAIVGVDVQDDEQSARAFLERYRVTYPNGQDRTGEVSIAYGMSGVPESYFIDRDHRIVRKWAGPLDDSRLGQFVEELLR